MSASYARKNGIKDESQCLLLVTKGRKSGEKRAVALTYFIIAGNLLVVGSKGGAPQDPAWVENLRAEPRATIYQKRRKRSVTARIAADAERAALWAELAEKVPTYAHFQQQVSREIPLVILE
jgi:proline iminopeptidase